MRPSPSQRTPKTLGRTRFAPLPSLVVFLLLVVGVVFLLLRFKILPPDGRGHSVHHTLPDALPSRMAHRIGFDALVEIRPGGLPPELASQVVFPLEGWLLEILFERGASTADSRSLGIEIEIETSHRIAGWPVTAFRPTARGLATTIDTAPLPQAAGELRIRARWASGDEGGDSPASWTETKIELQARTGPAPIGRGQVLYFDFEVDRNGDGIPDFHRDLEAFGLASPEHPVLGREVGRRVARAALARARRAYAGPIDPIVSGPIDPVAIELRLDDGGDGEITRICVGGGDPSGGRTVGNLRFDPGNGDRRSTECGELPATGIFPRALLAYREDALFRGTFDPLQPDHGGLPVGRHPKDASILTGTPGARFSDAEDRARTRVIGEAIDVFANALGSIMAHEAAHALGLVAPGNPSEGGLYGGREESDAYHRMPSEANDPGDGDRDGGRPIGLMSSGPALSFAQLAGRGVEGELVFDPLSLAYLRDDILLPRPTSATGPEPASTRER
jgi:hypothetical protein